MFNPAGTWRAGKQHPRQPCENCVCSLTIPTHVLEETAAAAANHRGLGKVTGIRRMPRAKLGSGQARQPAARAVLFQHTEYKMYVVSGDTLNRKRCSSPKSPRSTRPGHSSLPEPARSARMSTPSPGSHPFSHSELNSGLIQSYLVVNMQSILLHLQPLLHAPETAGQTRPRMRFPSSPAARTPCTGH